MKSLLLAGIFYLTFNFSYCQSTADVFDIGRKGTVDQVQEKLKENPNSFNVVNDDGYSPLLLACYRGNNDVAKYLIEAGSDINSKSKFGTALMACIVKANNEIAKLLIAKKADLNFADGNGMTALIYAINFKNYELVEALVKAKVAVEYKDSKNNTALDYAIQADDDKLIELLKAKN